MIRLSQQKIEGLLHQKGLSLSSLARESGISRQSLYNMLRGANLFSTPFVKLIRYLRINPKELTEEVSPGKWVMEGAPIKIQKIALELKRFSENQNALLILFGSRARGGTSAGADWDFGIYFLKREEDRGLRNLKGRLQERSFPYRVDVVKLNGAPSWFLKGVQEEGIVLFGSEEVWVRTISREAA